MIKLGNTTTSRMSDSEVIDSLFMLEGFQDAALSGQNDDKFRVSDTLRTLKMMYDTHNPELQAILADQPEFYGLSLESVGTKLRDMMKTNCIEPAQEGHMQDFLHDGLIGAIIHWDDHTSSELKKLIPEMKSRVMEADESIFGKWKLFFQIGIYSKYLPDYEDFAGAVKALKNAFAYLKSTKPPKFDPNKYVQFFINTCYNENSWVQEYMKAAKKAMIADTAAGFTYGVTAGAAASGAIAAAQVAAQFCAVAVIVAVIFKWQSDIRKRGWTDRAQFLKALDEAGKLVKEMEALATIVGKYKGTAFEGDQYPIAKAYFKACEQTTKLAGYLGRGVVAASRSIGGSVWRRIFTLDR